MIKQVAWKKSSLLLKNILHSKFTKQILLKLKVFRDIIKMPRWKAWVERARGLIKSGCGVQALKVRVAFFVQLSRKCFVRVTICN
jgi:hypothetical protein